MTFSLDIDSPAGQKNGAALAGTIIKNITHSAEKKSCTFNLVKIALWEKNFSLKSALPNGFMARAALAGIKTGRVAGLVVKSYRRRRSHHQP